MWGWDAVSDYDADEAAGNHRQADTDPNRFGPGDDSPVAPLALPEQRCAWCGVLLRVGTQPVSHGICAPCATKLLGERA